MEECIQREIIEETGFKNFEIKRVIYETAYGREYKARKNREEEGVDTVFYVQLLDDTQAEGHSCDEHQNMEWFDETDLLDKLGLDHHLEYFKRHLAGPGAYTDDGILINSGEFTGLMSAEAREKLTAYAEEK
ncbi:MAG: NUDIX domain-containing protein [Candidatus Peribacteria bacterium]|nr:MAG: NUDIX domain-containing protein [Candidatus Peribacteria bacterium]